MIVRRNFTSGALWYYDIEFRLEGYMNSWISVGDDGMGVVIGPSDALRRILIVRII